MLATILNRRDLLAGAAATCLPLRFSFGHAHRQTHPQDSLGRGPITGIVPCDGGLLVAQESRLWLVDSDSLEPLESFELPLAKTTRLVGLGDSRVLVVGGDPGERGVLLEVRLESHGLTELMRFESEGDLFEDAAAVAGDSQFWIAGRDQKITIVDRRDPTRPARQLEGHSGAVTRVISLDEERVVTTSTDRSLRVWSANDGSLLRELQQHVGGIVDAVKLPTNDPRPQLVTLGLDRTVRLWQPTIGRMVRFVRLDQVATRLFVDSQGRVWACGRSGSLMLLDLGASVIERHLPIDEFPCYATHIDTDTTVLLAGSHGTLKRVTLD